MMILHFVFLLVFLCHVECGNFLGASLSYTFRDNDTADITLITSWVLGHGLCGQVCSTADIGSLSIPKGTNLAAKYPEFGRFNPDDINDQISHTVEVQVIAVSQRERWEQDLMKFSINLNTSKKNALEYTGQYWKDFDYQGSNLPWSLPNTIVTFIRNDTHKPNSSPHVLLRPYYSVKWNGTTIISLTTIDQDGDVVKCDVAKFIDAGVLKLQKGVKVYENCSIQIDAFESYGYRNDTWFGLAVVLRDFSTNVIKMGPDVFLPMDKSYYMSHSVVQFAIHIINTVTRPFFVEPTPSEGQKYGQYIGSAWNVRMCANGSENYDMSRFILTTRDNTTISQSTFQNGKDGVKCVELSWSPSTVDIGLHLVCIAAVDTSGMISDKDRCYVVEVKGEKFNKASNNSMTKPYFVDFPGNGDRVKCSADTVCVLPIYAKSASKVTSIKVISHYTKMAKTSEMKTVLRKGEKLYQADVSFIDDSHGMKEICVVATDEHGVASDETCFNADVIPDDPCYSSPCRNSARCKMVDTSGAFICECRMSYSGRLCEHMENRCSPDPCVHGYCVTNIKYDICYCKHGFTGTYCETSINDCPGSSCNSRGACVDKVDGYRCDCTQRYTGDNCEVDICPGQPVDQFSCSAHAECDPNPCIYGKCSAGPNCTCATGYRGDLCDTAIDAPQNTAKIQIIPPSPPYGSQIVCYKNNDSLLPCHLMVYISSNNSFNIKMESSPGLKTTWKVGLANEVNSYRKVFTVLTTLQGNLTTNQQPYVCLNVLQLGSESNVCYSINIQLDPMASNTSLQYLRQNATWKFLDPTLNRGSRIMCPLGQPCRVMLYTNSYKETCHDIVPTSTANLVTIFPAYYHNDTGICSTEVDINQLNGTETEVCFLAGLTDYQQLCLLVNKLSAQENPCVNNPCQHEGRCFYDSPHNYHCVCEPGYVGDNCETGPCSQRTDDCMNDGYCLSYNTTNTCICRTGYAGSKCEIFASLQSQLSKPAYFYGAAKPTIIECVVNQLCSFSQIIEVSDHLAHKPVVVNGFVSAGLTVNTNIIQHNRSFEADLMMLAERTGLHDACVQIRDQKGHIDDEFCFKVRAITDPYTLYGRKNRPHFVGSSLPTGTHAECVAGEPCHLLYQVTTGQGNENDCNEVKITPSDDFAKYHVFSTCDTCSIRGKVNATCSVDVSMVTDVTDAGTNHTFTVLARLRESGLEGEERTFNLTILRNDTRANSGCQRVQCLNEGFCDGHVSGAPQCYCKQGYSGVQCEKAEIQITASSNLTQTFIGDIAVPSEIECERGTVGSIPFQVVRKPGSGTYKAPKIEMKYTNGSISVDGPFIVKINTEEYIGYVNVTCIMTGTQNVCLQTENQGRKEDDICVAVNVVSSDSRSERNVDKNYPYFLEPTLPDGSAVLCEVNKSCHLDLHYTTGDLFGVGATCPQMVEANHVSLNGMHIFEPKLYSHYCKNDVVYLPSEANVTRQLCLQVSFPGKPGEIRCVNIKVVDQLYEEVSSPCRNHECGDVSRFKCVPNFTTSPPFAECVCQTGFTGARCSQATTCNVVCANSGYCDEDVCFCVDGFGGEHCEIVFNPCATNPCVRGLCFHHQTDYHCVCPPGYDGKTCTIDVNECTSQPCYNGGLCIDGINSYTCNCSSGFTGDRCQTNVDECMSNPCLHGGTCHDEIDQYSCQCPPEYKGDRCETEVNPCDSSPCVHGGCYHHLLAFHCVCEDGYTGIHCDTDIDECISTPCMNGGICIDAINQFSCNCSAGFTGVVCETDINECASSPCLNGGFCHDELDHFICHCPSGYEGVKCEKVVDPCIPNPCNTGVCFSMGQQIYCDCPQRYTGKSCEIFLGLQLIGPKEVTLNVDAGSEIKLNCSVSSNNPVTFVWNKMNLCEDLSNKTFGSVLEVTKNASIGNIGIFVCTATDSKDPNITKYFNVHVNVQGFSETCNFDDGTLCKWNKRNNGGMDWVLRNGIKSLVDGGILFDHTVGSTVGNYLYVETTLNRNFDDRAILISSILPAKHTLCFEFWYYLYGDDVGQIAVALQDTCLKTETRLFMELSNHGNKWLKSSNTISKNSVPNDYRVIIKADIGSTDEGDVAIDDLAISDGVCNDDHNPVVIG